MSIDHLRNLCDDATMIKASGRAMNAEGIQYLPVHQWPTQEHQEGAE